MTERELAYERLTAAFVGATLGDWQPTVFELAIVNAAMAAAEADDAAVALMREDGELCPAVATSETTRRVEGAQRSTRSPLLDAVRSAHIVVAGDLTDDRWSGCAHAALAAGFRSEIALPLTRKRAMLGVVTVFRTRRGPWDDHVIDSLRHFAATAAGLVASWHHLGSLHSRADQLQHALEARVTIEQAKGIVAAHLDVNTDRAFALLRDHARRSNATVRSIAQAVVELRVPPSSLRAGGRSMIESSWSPAGSSDSAARVRT